MNAMDAQQKDFSPAADEQKYKLGDDFGLLEAMLNDSKVQPERYTPGRYWATKVKNAASDIKRYGIQEFRGSKNTIGLSYSDSLLLDIRKAYGHGLKGRLIRGLTGIYPLSVIFANQVELTKSYANTRLAYAQEMLNLKERVGQLLRKYRIPYSILGGCLDKVKIDGREVAVHYLNLLEQHDRLASRIRFDEARSVFEIGGGFGINVHLLLENHKNIRKVLYLDIPPNLYIGTQYLKAFYGAAVFDYRAMRQSDVIKFSANDDLEIFCVAPWQIERFSGSVDIFINSHSFVEMPPDVVGNYAEKFSGFSESENSTIALTTYDDFRQNETINPEALPGFFKNREFVRFEAETLLNSSRKNLFFVSSGKLSL